MRLNDVIMKRKILYLLLSWLLWLAVMPWLLLTVGTPPSFLIIQDFPRSPNTEPLDPQSRFSPLLCIP